MGEREPGRALHCAASPLFIPFWEWLSGSGYAILCLRRRMISTESAGIQMTLCSKEVGVSQLDRLALIPGDVARGVLESAYDDVDVTRRRDP
ncbi:hypothetical protein [Streptomyces sp. NPDC002187]|uniref:hypothetical protein n=1 Tax=Streptomyces sp. NPDC002187 TaxID=3364637 RepID=UPI0036868DB1